MQDFMYDGKEETDRQIDTHTHIRVNTNYMVN